MFGDAFHGTMICVKNLESEAPNTPAATLVSTYPCIEAYQCNIESLGPAPRHQMNLGTLPYGVANSIYSLHPALS